MMIKKQLGVLAGAVVAASSANAAITLTGDALAVFNATGNGSFYQVVDAGVVTGNSLASGNGFSIDISSALAALGGTIDSFALVALKDGVNTYNYTEFLYVQDGGGLVFAGTSDANSTNLEAINQINALQSVLDNANLGLNGEGSLGDFDSFAIVADLVTTGLNNVVLAAQTLGGSTNTQFVSLAAPSGAQDGVYIDGSTFNATTEGGGPVIPVPAAAWLFGSALVGLGVVRRKK